MNTEPLIFYHSPQTRSSGVRILLEELGAPHRLQILNMKIGEQRNPEYMAINPMGKVPAICHNGTLVTEQVAIYIYLTDAFPEKGLAPAIGDPLRGSYLRWIAYYGSCFEPAVTDKALQREPGSVSMMPYGDFDTMLKTLTDQLAKDSYILGERFSAADILWGTALEWMVTFKLLPDIAVINDYVKRVAERPSVQKIKVADAELASSHEKFAKEQAE
jgi:glutathione S-transferase